MTFKLKDNPAYDFYSGEYPIAWDKMVGEQTPKLLIFKASQYRWRDSKTEEYVREAKSRGFKYGLYHFLHENDIQAQFDTFLSVIKSCGGYGNCVPIIDVEIIPKNSGKVWASQIKTFLDLIEKEFGVKAMIYTSEYYWSFTFSKNIFGKLVSPSWGKDYYLWQASYPNNPDSVSHPKPVADWNDWAIWQYNESGRSNGYVANDLNTVSSWFLNQIGDSVEIPVEEPKDDSIVLTGVKYSVITDILNLRPESNTLKTPLAKLTRNSVVFEIGKNSDSTWINVKTSDGKIGWCSAMYLKQIENGTEETPAPIPEGSVGVLESRELFNGKAFYVKQVRSTDHGDVTFHILKVKRENASIFITPRPSGVTYVPNFLEKYNMDIAINGDGFMSVKKGRSWNLVMAGLSSSNGQPYGTSGAEGAIYISKDGYASLTRPNGKELWNAIAFPNLLVENGVKTNIKRKDVDPRTSLGFTKDSDIIIVTADGKETYNMYRTGASFDDLAEVMLESGAWLAVNLDGGGSSTLVVRDEIDNAPRILNVPCGENSYRIRNEIFKLRPVANHFGIKIL